MTTCVDDLTLLALIAGRLDAGRAAAVWEHLAACDRCRELHADLNATWQLLAEGDHPPPERDLTTAIVTAAQAERRLAPRWTGVLRFAASVAVAAGIGSLTAWVAGPPTRVPGDAAVDRTELVSLMGFDALSGTNMISPLLSPADDADDPAAGEVTP